VKIRWQDTKGVLGESSVILSLRYDRGRDTPADSLVCQLALKKPMGELCQLWLEEQGRQLFHGFLDKQEQWEEGGWQMLRLTARGLGGLLLDYEAMPQVYESPTMEQVFRRHCLPYGAVNGVGAGGVSGRYVVSKGMSQWEAFSQFCRRVTGLYPFLQGDTVVIQPASPKIWRFGAGGLPTAELRQIYSRHRVIAQVAIRDKNGLYTSIAQNQEAMEKGIRRQRYLIPSPQWALDAGGSGDSLLRQSAAQWETWQVQAAGVFTVAPGDFVSCRDGWGREFSGTAHQVQVEAGPAGRFTHITICRE